MQKQNVMMRVFLTVLSFFLPFLAMAQWYPSVDPVGTYYKADKDGGEESGDVNGTTQSAPLKVVFQANPSNIEELGTPRYEWKIWNTSTPSDILLQRNEPDVEYTFVESGTFMAQLKVTFYDTDGGIYSEFPEEGEDAKIISFTISESKLSFPNAFSPNGDGYNDMLRPKDDYQSIVDFEACVFNRWGNKLYSWTDITGGWDGKYRGKTVKDGVYYLVVKAKGADGRDFTIRKTITVLTGYNNGDGASVDNE